MPHYSVVLGSESKHGEFLVFVVLGKDLHAGQTLDNLASRFKVNGKSVETFERLVEAMDAAGHRAGRRLPIVIDGLNESEDPRNWKDLLSRADELLKALNKR